MTPDTIAALATAPGAGALAVIRISGPAALAIGEGLSGLRPQPRRAHLARFHDGAGRLIDEGLLLYFPAPHSFTGEAVIELQGHGGLAVSQLLLQTVIAAGARLAEPGEFSKRAFLNGKMDLAQAEAVADLINARSFSAVRAANRSLQGDFSQAVNELAAELLQLRLYLEAALDFPEEEIDFLSDGKLAERLESWLARLAQLLRQVDQGRLLNEGIKLVLAGKPNVGKSSLLNALLGEERAMVSATAGTTRDVIREQLLIAGMPVQILDTAGLRPGGDELEREGMRRARAALEQADLALWLVDGSQLPDLAPPPPAVATLKIYSKADLVPMAQRAGYGDGLWLSARDGSGLEELRQAIAQRVGLSSDEEAPFIGRERHRQALLQAQALGRQALEQLRGQRLPELVAEDLRRSHSALGTITGQVSADELLGEIFSSFCIGK